MASSRKIPPAGYWAILAFVVLIGFVVAMRTVVAPMVTLSEEKTEMMTVERVGSKNVTFEQSDLTFQCEVRACDVLQVGDEVEVTHVHYVDSPDQPIVENVVVLE